MTYFWFVGTYKIEFWKDVVIKAVFDKNNPAFTFFKMLTIVFF